MKGYWHLPAFALVISSLTIIFEVFYFAILYLLWLYYLFYKNRLKTFHVLFSVVVLMLFLFYIPKIVPPDENHELLLKSSFIGKIKSPLEKTDKFVRLIFQEEQSKEKILLYHFLNKEEIEEETLKPLKYGAICKISGEIKLPDSSTNPGQFNYQKYLLERGISFEIKLPSLEHIDCSGFHPLHLIYSLRHKAISYTKALLSKETSAWINALVLGDDSLITKEIKEIFNRWSLSHILAISGLHVGLVIGLLYVGLVKFNLMTRERAEIIIIIFLPFYALLAGGAPSVWRASLMGLIFLILSKLQIKYSVTDILSIIFITLVTFDRYIIYNIGFQFSFLVTFGLFLSRKWFLHTSSKFWQLMKISFISQMIITPLQLHYFYFFQPLSILANLFVVPYFSLFVIPTMFILLIISPIFPRLALTIDQLFLPIHKLFLKAIKVFDQYLNQPWILGELDLIPSLIYFGLLLWMMKTLEQNQLKQSFTISVFLVSLLFLVSIKPYFSAEGYVTMLDIGQGDAFIIELPHRKGVIFVDAGASFSFDTYEVKDKIYKQILEPYLFSRGISSIDAIIVSHEDLDHNGSIPFLVENLSVKQIIVSEFYKFNEKEEEAILNNEVMVKRVKADETFSIKSHPFKVLSPNIDRKDDNDNSLVVLTNLGGKRWLFTGDISKDVEKEITNRYKNLRIDILKVAHHGSKTSSDEQFIRQLNPSFALIPVGRKNRYGHPSTEVLDTMEGIRILRSDFHGAVQYRFKKDRGVFKTYLESKRD